MLALKQCIMLGAEFGTGQAMATVSATCEQERAGVTWMNPSGFIAALPQREAVWNSSSAEQGVEVVLENVAATCAGVRMDTPCAAGEEDLYRPKLFTCKYIGSLGTKDFGPYVRMRPCARTRYTSIV